MKTWRHASLAGLVSLLAMHASPAWAIDVARPEVQKFIDSMVATHDYDGERLKTALAAAETQPAILEAISKPAEKTLSWPEYRAIFITDDRIGAGVAFWRQHEDDLREVSEATGVPEEILVGVIGVETYFGRITGKYRVLDALATLAFDYPPRSAFFRRELEEFLLLVREEDMDATAATGSYAGAMGAPQFMPSSYRAYAVDSDEDGKRDIWSDWRDVIGSIANFLAAHGWQASSPIIARATLGGGWRGPLPENALAASDTVASLSDKGVMFSTDLPGNRKGQLLTFEGPDDDEYWVAFDNFFVITRYNRSVMYAMAVHQLGQKIALEVDDGVT